jgi:hypothetical protein
MFQGDTSLFMNPCLRDVNCAANMVDNNLNNFCSSLLSLLLVAGFKLSFSLENESKSCQSHFQNILRINCVCNSQLM